MKKRKTTTSQKKPVLCRFRETEITQIQRETGVEGAGAAVAAYVRKSLNSRRSNHERTGSDD